MSTLSPTTASSTALKSTEVAALELTDRRESGTRATERIRPEAPELQAERGGDALSPLAAEHYPVFLTTDFSTMTTPALVVHGDHDDSTHLTVAGPAWHTDPYELSPGPKSLLTLFEAGSVESPATTSRKPPTRTPNGWRCCNDSPPPISAPRSIPMTGRGPPRSRRSPAVSNTRASRIEAARPASRGVTRSAPCRDVVPRRHLDALSRVGRGLRLPTPDRGWPARVQTLGSGPRALGPRSSRRSSGAWLRRVRGLRLRWRNGLVA
jgi:hypothetical protein